MGVAYKNFWSINTDEAIAAGHLRNYFLKGIEVFMPLNAQMKDVDLLVYNSKTGRGATIQVKGSRAYEPQKKEIRDYGDGSATWFMFKREVIDKSEADYFIFVHHILNTKKKLGRREIEPHFITIPTSDLKEKMKVDGYVVRGNRYALYTWINPSMKKAFGIKKNNIDFTRYLDGKGFALLARNLSKQSK